MAVISFMSTKGGAGKTTAAAVVTSVLAHAGATVALLDADPNQPLARWLDPKETPSNLKLVGGLSEQTIIETIERESARNQFVLVDLEGSPNIAMSYALSMSELVIIPVQASLLDADEAAKTIGLVHRQRKSSRAPIDCAVLWQRVSGAITSQTMKTIETQFADASISVLSSRLVEREAFRAMFTYSKLLSDLPPSVTGLGKAVANANELVSEIVNRWKMTHGNAA
jgi:chromosome partitioning protein